MGTVTSFKYLGAVVSGDGSKPEILSRNCSSYKAKANLERGQNNSGIKIETKVVWSRRKVFCFSKDDSTGHSKRKKEEEVDRRRDGKTILKSGQDGL